MKIICPELVAPTDPPDLLPPVDLIASSPAVAPSVTAVSPPVAGPSSDLVISASVPLPDTSTAAPSYAERFKSSLRNLRKIASPVLLEDGSPVVQAPASVLLKSADQWKGHIIAKFHGLIPPASKIFSDLNPAWGKFGNIIIRNVSDTSCLIMIPCSSTREWVLQVGYWQADNCAFSVIPWSVDASLRLEELETAPTWAVIKNVPPQMYSLDGISVIASAIGEPLHTEKSKLDPYNFGNTKVKVEISLDKSPPTTIIVRDSHMNSVKVNVSYPRLPPKCCNCGRFGHLLNRCPKPLMKKKAGVGTNVGLVPNGVVVADTKIPLGKGLGGTQEWRVVSSSTHSKSSDVASGSSEAHKRTRIRVDSRRRSKERSRSSPPMQEVVRHQSDQSMSVRTQQAVKDWIKERNEKKHIVLHEAVKEAVKEVVPEAQWTLVGSKYKGKEKPRQLVVAKRPIPGAMSVKKFAKLEAKILFSNKKRDEASQAKLSGPEKYRLSPISSVSQPNRGKSSVSAV